MSAVKKSGRGSYQNKTGSRHDESGETENEAGRENKYLLFADSKGMAQCIRSC